MNHYKVKTFTPTERLSDAQTLHIVDFLHTHLQEYGDEKKDIKKAIDYAMKQIPSAGGFVLTYNQGDEIVGAVVVNKTGMGGYIPENILVYIAIHQQYRGQGIGKKMMQEALATAEGDVALHVEPNNPAKFLYEKLGFENKYLEMRYKK